MTKRVNQYASPWTPPVVDRMLALHAKGVSASGSAQILSDEFGWPFTRNAVIGAWHRRGLCSKAPDRPMVVRERRKYTSPNRKVIRQFIKRSAPEDKLSAAEWVERVAAVVPRHLNLLDLERNDCRYPYGEGATITFCGHCAAPGRPYCAEHVALTGTEIQTSLNRSEAAKATWERRRASAA